MDARLTELKQRLAEISDVGKAQALVSWDQRVLMPPAGGAVRAEQLATLSKIIHEKFTSPELGRLLEELEPYGESLPYDSDDACLIRVTKRDFEKAVRVPKELRVEIARATSRGYEAWQEARTTSNFELLRPHLERNVELRREYGDCFKPYDDPYDPLLDDFEPFMKTAEVQRVFDVLKPELKAIVADVASREPIDVSPLYGSFPADRQKQFALVVLDRFGFDPTKWRFDETAHPFATNTGINDIRLTGRYDDRHFEGVFSAMHEFGHGVYEHGVDLGLERTPLARGVSMALHESQSRLWENLVGRSRAFWHYFFPKAQEAFPEAFGDLSEEALYRAVNAVQPSLIRVQADQVTYSLHIILRFELEREMIAGLDLRELPGLWNERMKDLLGVDVPDDAHGVLQDVHWGGGGIGYFPTYALGNVVSAQLWERIGRELPERDELFARGEFGELREWLRDNIYRHGRKFTPQEMLERVTGGGLDPAPYVRYLRQKVDEIYGAGDVVATTAATT